MSRTTGMLLPWFIIVWGKSVQGLKSYDWTYRKPGNNNSCSYVDIYPIKYICNVNYFMSVVCVFSTIRLCLGLFYSCNVNSPSFKASEQVSLL